MLSYGLWNYFPPPIGSYYQPTPNTPKLEALLDNLKYVYLEDEERLLVIISTSLTVEQE